MDAAAKLERVLGPGWETLTTSEVEQRARELERANDFAWAVLSSMRAQEAPTVGSVLQLAHVNGDHE